MKALKTTFCLLLAACLLTVPVWAIDLEPGTGEDFYVRDTANVLSSSTEDAIVQYNAVLESECDGAQLVVVTVNYLDEEADTAATRLMNDWGIGDAARSNGMLLLLAVNEYRGGITAGDGIDDAFFDSFNERYYDKFWDDVDADRFDKAVQTFTEHIYDWYLDYYDVDMSAGSYGGSPAYAPEPSTTGGGFFSGLFGLLALLVIAVVVLWIIGAASRFTRMRRWGYSGGFFPIFWFGGRQRYRSYRDQFRPPPPPGPRPGPGGPAGFGGPGGFMGGGFNTRSSFRPSGRGGGGRAGGNSFRSSGGSFRSGGGFRGGGGGGHSGGGFRGRR